MRGCGICGVCGRNVLKLSEAKRRPSGKAKPNNNAIAAKSSNTERVIGLVALAKRAPPNVLVAVLSNGVARTFTFTFW